MFDIGVAYHQKILHTFKIQKFYNNVVQELHACCSSMQLNTSYHQLLF